MRVAEATAAPFSLIRYEAEIEVSDNVEEYEKAKASQKGLDLRPSPEDVLNSMIPPRDWETKEGKKFMQYVSHQKAEREDVLQLQDTLEKTLAERQARTEGLCAIREELFSQAFDEIIRQVTINCPERGLMLMRVRDEHKMTVAAYRTLHRSAVSFSMLKQVEAQEGMPELEAELLEAQQEFDRFRQREIELQSKLQLLEKKQAEARLETQEDHSEEIASIEDQRTQLEHFLALVKEQKTDDIFMPLRS